MNIEIMINRMINIRARNIKTMENYKTIIK